MRIAVSRNERGFTLLEIVLVMVLIGILSVIIVVPVMTGARAWNEMSRQKETVQQARIALERFVRELRAIQRVNGRPSIVEMSANNIRFIMSTGEELEYGWGGTGLPLVRTVWNGGVATPDDAAMNVQGFDLTYYEDSNAEIIQLRQEAESSPDVTCAFGNCAVLGDVRVLDEDGESVRYDFTGTRVAWIGPKDVGLGVADIGIDTNPPGGPGFPQLFPTVDQFASVAATEQPLFMSPQFDYDDYTITISCNDASNPDPFEDCATNPVEVDAFDLLVSRVVVELEVGDGDFTTSLRDQVSFRWIE